MISWVRPALFSAGGTVASTFDYAPYGRLACATGTANTRIGYTGGITDSATGLLYLLNRYYDPRTGQFLTG